MGDGSVDSEAEVTVKTRAGSGKDVEGALGPEEGTAAEQVVVVVAALRQHQRQEELPLHGEVGRAGVGVLGGRVRGDGQGQAVLRRRRERPFSAADGMRRKVKLTIAVATN